MPYKDPNDPRKKESLRKGSAKYYANNKEKVQKLNKEVLIVVRDSENSEIILNSVDYTHVIVKSLIKTIIKPDIGLIDEEWHELLLEKGSCVQFQFVEDVWLILSSDGIKLD